MLIRLLRGGGGGRWRCGLLLGQDGRVGERVGEGLGVHDVHAAVVEAGGAAGGLSEGHRVRVGTLAGERVPDAVGCRILSSIELNKYAILVCTVSYLWSWPADR